jgi:Protein of unknown function (DUF2934)
MDNQLEQRIRDRAYELWMQNGCLPDRAQDYWYQAESEILGEAGAPGAGDAGMGGSASSAPFLGDAASGGEGAAPVEVSAAPLGMTSQTTDEVLPQSDEGLLTVPDAPKARKRRAAAPAEEQSAAPAASPRKGKRTTRPT